MSLIVAGAFAVVLLLLVLRLSQRLTLRLRVLAGVSLSRPASKSCPHLGIASDPFSHENLPTDDHRCYLWMQRDRIDLVHQKGFCLSTAHHKCPWLMMRRPDAPPPLRQRLPGLVAGLPRGLWGGLRAAPGLAMAFVGSVRKLHLPRRHVQPATASVASQAAPARPLPDNVAAALEDGTSIWARPAAAAAERPSFDDAAEFDPRTVWTARPGQAPEELEPVAAAEFEPSTVWTANANEAPQERAREAAAVAAPARLPSIPAGPRFQTLRRALAAAQATALALIALIGRGLSAAGQAAVRGVAALSPKVAQAAVIAGRGLRIATVWSARTLWLLSKLLGRFLLWAGRHAVAAAIAGSHALAAALAARQQAIRERRAAAQAAREAALPPVMAAAVSDAVAPLPVIAAAVAQAPEPVAEPVQPPSLAKLEDLLAEGLAAMDRGEEGLAYHIFVKATEQRVPRGHAEAYADVMKRAWFWRAKTSETVQDLAESLEQALRFEPGNLQMQAHLAWARQRLEREQKLLPIDAATQLPDQPKTAAAVQRAGWWASLGVGMRIAGGLMALALAALWMTTGVLPALGTWLSQLPAGDELMLRRLVLTINATALPGKGHLPLPGVNYDLGLALPFVLGFLFVFTARGLVDGDGWARTTGLLLAGAGGWLCAAAVTNPDASRLGLVLCVGVIVAAMLGRFEPQRSVRASGLGY